MISLVLELRRDASQRLEVLWDGRCVRILAFQIFVYRFSHDLVAAALHAEEPCAQARGNPQVQIRGPQHHRHLLKDFFEVPVIEGFDGAWGPRFRGFHEAHDVPMLVADGRAANCQENGGSILAQPFGVLALRKFASNGRVK